MACGFAVTSCGPIMPEPLAIPPMAMVAPFDSSCTAQVFGTRSVVRIACAAAAPPSSDKAAAAASIPAETVSIGRCSPMTPVDDTRISSVDSPSAAAACPAIAAASSRPRCPVQALALPLLTTTARMVSHRSSSSRPCTTGAATIRLAVNAAATVAGRSLRMMATSGLPLALMPQAMPAAL